MNLSLIFAAERRALVQRINRIVQDGAIAEELTQETFARVQVAMASGQVERVEAFLRKTARNLAIDHRRQVMARRTVNFTGIGDRVVADIEDHRPSAETALIDRQRLAVLRTALGGLPERAQKVLLLSRLEGLTQDEIAQRLGVSQRTVFNDLKHALEHCSLMMERHDG